MAKKKPGSVKDKIFAELAPGKSLPAKFDAFLAAEPQLPVEWNNLADFGLKDDGLWDVVPFLKADGGYVALWWYRDPYPVPDPAVVHFGPEGEQKVVAPSFDEFLKAAAIGKSGIADLDKCEPRLKVEGVEG